MTPKRKGLFIDRDGVLVTDDRNWNLKGQEIYPFTAQALEELYKEDFELCVVSSAARGVPSHFDKASVLAVDDYIRENTPEVPLHIYHLWDIHKGGKEGQTTKEQLVLKAAKEWDIDLNYSYLIGDKTSDIETARRLKEKGYTGLRSIGMMTGWNMEDREYNVTPDCWARDISIVPRLLRGCYGVFK